MLAMVVNDSAGHLKPLGVFTTIASRLAPTGEAFGAMKSHLKAWSVVYESC